MCESVEDRFQPPLLDPTLGPLRVTTRLSHFANITVSFGGKPDMNRQKPDITRKSWI
jgi:hypothetical protein